MVDWVAKLKAVLPCISNKLTLIILGRAFIRKERRTLLNGVSIDIYLCRDNSGFLGWSILDNIVISELKSYSTDAKDLILLHEYGHKRLFPFTNLIFIPISLFFGLMAIFSFLAILTVEIESVLKLNNVLRDQPIPDALFFVIPFVSGFIGFMLLSYVNEGFAGYYALKVMGREKYLKTWENLKQNAPHRTWFRQLIQDTLNFILYPPNRILLFIYDIKNKQH